MKKGKGECPTRGDVYIDNLEVGDVIWEFDGSYRAMITVVSTPFYDPKDGGWKFVGRTENGTDVDYFQTIKEEWCAYGLKLYTYQAYI